MGEDSIGTYYRVAIAILPGVHAEGIYIVPKALTAPAPLVIAIHGGAGSPALALFNGGTNYHDMVRGGVKRGFAVFAPQLLFSSPGLPKDHRKTIDERMRLVGTSLTAVEAAKIIHSLDVLLKRPEIDPTRVGLVGLSYGGYYSWSRPPSTPASRSPSAVATTACRKAATGGTNSPCRAISASWVASISFATPS